MTVRHLAGSIAVPTLLLALCARPLTAQELPLRRGFFIGFGAGGGGGEVTGNTDANGGGGWLTLGGTVNQKLRLAADFEGFASSNAEDETYGTSTFSALWYPSARGNFFLKGGVGAATVRIQRAGSPDGSGIGFGTVLGAGYDIRLGRKVSITPQFTMFGGSTGDVTDDDKNVIRNDVKFGVAMLSVGVVFH